MNLTLTPQKNALLQGFNNEFYALLQFSHKSSGQVSESSKPLNLSIVIDRSGSMSGQPIIEAKNAAEMMVRRLRPSDKISIIAFDTYVDVIVPTTNCEDISSIINGIRNIETCGATNLHGGWLAGAEQVASGKTEQSLNRVLLLSDGGANQGITDQREIVYQCSSLAETNIATSTYGLGRNFNEELMINMASNGLGHSYYGQTSDDLMDPFNEEFETLLRTVATNIKLKYEHPSFVKCELMNNYKVVDKIIKLPDLAQDSKVWALFKLNIKRDDIQNQSIEVLRCNLSYMDVNNEVKNKGPVKIKLDPVNQNAFEMIATDPEVELRFREILVARYQERARESAKLGDWASVEMYLDSAKEVAKDNEWLLSVIDSIEKYAKQRKQQEFSKEAMYSSEKMQKRLASDDELNMSYDYNIESEKQAYLRRKTERGKRF